MAVIQLLSAAAFADEIIRSEFVGLFVCRVVSNDEVTSIQDVSGRVLAILGEHEAIEECVWNKTKSVAVIRVMDRRLLPGGDGIAVWYSRLIVIKKGKYLDRVYAQNALTRNEPFMAKSEISILKLYAVSDDGTSVKVKAMSLEGNRYNTEEREFRLSDR